MIVKHLTTMAGASLVGVAILAALMTVIILLLNFVIPSKPSPIQGVPGEDFEMFLKVVVITYTFSSGLAGFISGYLLEYWSGEIVIHSWQSLVISFMVGVVIPLILLSTDILWLTWLPIGLWTKGFITERTIIFIWGAIASLGGLFGSNVACNSLWVAQLLER